MDIKFKLFDESQKSILWGGIDCSQVLEKLEKLISDCEENYIDLIVDFEGIKSIDKSFVYNVFVSIINNNLHKKINLIFMNIGTDSITYYIHKVLEEFSIPAVVKNKEKEFFIGVQFY